jgi:hypothetical protein
MRKLDPPKNVRMIDPPRCAVCRYLTSLEEVRERCTGEGHGCARTEDKRLPSCPGGADYTLMVCDGFRR